MKTISFVFTLIILGACGQRSPSHVSFALRSQTTSSSALGGANGFSLSTDYCYAIMVSGDGTGLNRGPINSQTDANSCPNRPTQLGLIKGLYNAGDSVDLDLPLGTERFDLIGFKKVPTGGNHTTLNDCTGLFTVEPTAGSDVSAYLNGVEIDPQVVLIATATQTVSTGVNAVTLLPLSDANGVSMDCSPSHLSFAVTPVDASAGVVFSVPPQVKILDDQNQLSTAAVSVSLSAASDHLCQMPLSGALDGQTTVPNIAGYAKFPGVFSEVDGPLYLLATASNGLQVCSSVVQAPLIFDYSNHPNFAGRQGSGLPTSFPVSLASGAHCSATGLPPGISVNSTDCGINGSFAAPGFYAATITASLNGQSATANINFAVAPDYWDTVTSTGAPSARYNHCAVWTGSTSTNPKIHNKMIVFGGTDGTTPFGDGGVYDPYTGTWQPIANSFGGRVKPTCQWTDNGMYVWGGSSDVAGNVAPSTTGLVVQFNPGANSWTSAAMSTTGSPPPWRAEASAVWTGGNLFIFGGVLSGGVFSGTGVFSGSSWTAITATTAVARRSHTAVWDGTEMLVWGGYDFTSTGLAALGEKYGSGGWIPLPSTNSPPAASLHSSIWDGQHMIVWGGQGANSCIDGGTAACLNTGGVYDALAGTPSWTPTDSINAPSTRAAHTAVSTGAGMIVWGGSQNGALFNNGYQLTILGSVNTWSQIPDPDIGVAAPRYQHTAVWTGNQMIIWGGTSGVAAMAAGAVYTP